MEKLGAIVARQSAECKELALPGTRQLSRDSLVQMGTMLRQMSAAFPHQEQDPETAKVFLLTFEDLAVEFGMGPLEQALRWFLSRQKFFPHPSEVREELEAMAKKAKQEAEQELPPLGCDECKDSIAPGLTTEMRDGERYIRACACRIRRQAARRNDGSSQYSTQYDAKAKAAGE